MPNISFSKFIDNYSNTYMQIDECVDTMKRYGTPAIKSDSVPLFRGVHQAGASRAAYFKPRQSRIPRDSSPAFNYLFNTLVEGATGISNIRSKCYFASARFSVAEAYGTVGFCVPLGETKMVSIAGEEDLWGTWARMCSDGFSESVKRYRRGLPDSHLDVVNKISAGTERADKGEIVEEIFKIGGAGALEVLPEEALDKLYHKWGSERWHGRRTDYLSRPIFDDFWKAVIPMMIEYVTDSAALQNEIEVRTALPTSKKMGAEENMLVSEYGHIVIPYTALKILYYTRTEEHAVDPEELWAWFLDEVVKL